MAQPVGNLLEEWLGDISDEDSMTGDTYPFKVRVGCVKMAAPRHERFDMMLEMGSALIDKVFNGEPFMTDSILFMFPERHMSVHEQQSFMSALTKHPDVSKIKQIDIMTSSPLLISNFHKEMIRILTWPDDHNHDGTPNA